MKALADGDGDQYTGASTTRGGGARFGLGFATWPLSDSSRPSGVSWAQPGAASASKQRPTSVQGKPCSRDMHEPPRDAMAGQERASPAGRLENDTIDSPEGRIIRLPPGDDRRVERPPPHGRQSMAAARNPLELIVSGRRSGTGWCRTRVAHLPR